jgi:hypothetical protein
MTIKAVTNRLSYKFNGDDLQSLNDSIKPQVTRDFYDRREEKRREEKRKKNWKAILS